MTVERPRTEQASGGDEPARLAQGGNTIMIVATHAGRCSRCQRPFEPGIMIVPSTDADAWDHAICPPAHLAAEPRQRRFRIDQVVTYVETFYVEADSPELAVQLLEAGEVDLALASAVKEPTNREVFEVPEI